MKDDNATRYLLFTDEQKTEKGIKKLFNVTVSSYSEEMEMISLVIAKKKR